MKVWHGIPKHGEIAGKISLALGMFDGVHIGHQALLAAQKGHRVVYTFSAHPQTVLGSPPPQLTPLTEKLELLCAYGAEDVIVDDFTQQLAQRPADVFIHDLQTALGISQIVLGHDARFGAGAQGDGRFLQEYANGRFEVVAMPPVLYNGEPVSSSRIREAVAAGDMPAAEAMLGRGFSLCGQVVQGRQLGRTLGFPTANVQYPQQMILPFDGVYAGFVRVEGAVYRAAISVGGNPTVQDATVQNAAAQISVECHLLDFSGDIYGQNAVVIFKKLLRPVERFGSREALIAAISRDVETVRKICVSGETLEMEARD